MFNHQRLRVYGKAIGVAKRVPDIVGRWPRGMGYLVDQLRRAVASVVLNISEGNCRAGLKERARFFAIARASAAESSSAIDVALALGFIDESRASGFSNELLEIVKILYKLK